MGYGKRFLVKNKYLRIVIFTFPKWVLRWHSFWYLPQEFFNHKNTKYEKFRKRIDRCRYVISW